MKKILCIANPESIDLVSLIKEFLQTKSIVSNPEVTFISEQDELLIDGEVKKSVEIEKYSLIVVDQTLGWFPEKDASFHGYSLIEMLRRNKIAQPILVASQTSFENLKDESLGAKVINTPGHYHWDTIDFETNKPVDLHFHLSPEMLDDIIYSVFDIKGAFEESAHTLKHDISAAHQINWSNFKEEIEHLLKYAPDQSQVQDFDLNAEIDHLNNQPTVKNVDSLKERLIGFFESREDIVKEKQEPWQVLLVDDEVNTLEKYKNVFEESGIGCKTATNGPEAFEILEQDLENDITVLISDYRFFEKDTLTWQKLQGYDIIRYINNNLSNVLSYFLLTAKRSVLLRYARANTAPLIQCFEKGNLTESLNTQEGVKVFIDSIRNEGNRIHQNVISGPSAKSWISKGYRTYQNLPLSAYYKKYLENKTLFHEFEDKINRKVLDLIALHRSNIKKNAEEHTFKRFGFELANEDVELRAELKEPPESSEALRQFAWKKLFPRRVALAFYFEFHRRQLNLSAGNARPTDINEVTKEIANNLLQRFDEGLDEGKLLFNSFLGLRLNFETVINNELLQSEKTFFKEQGWL